MAHVEMYTKFMCPYCARASALFKQKGVPVTDIDITLDGAKRAVMVERSGGRTTVPQIFIDGRHIGGSDDLAALNEAGGLDPLIAV
ncbi:MAG: glutaredoxin 3 [Sphingomonadaceae bacterium]